MCIVVNSAEIQLYSWEQFVWIDETGCAAKDHIRRFGFALRGECPVYHRLLHRGKRISVTAGICSTGLLALELKKGTNNGDTFYDFIRGILIPNILPFNGQNPRSIAISWITVQYTMCKQCWIYSETQESLSCSYHLTVLTTIQLKRHSVILNTT